MPQRHTPIAYRSNGTGFLGGRRYGACRSRWLRRNRRFCHAFSNGLALRHLGEKPGELTALFVLAPVQPSRQRYERLENGWRYVDLGAAKGFTAVLTFDEHLIVRHYEGLFESLDSGEE